MSDIPVTFRESAYLLFNTAEGGACTSRWGNLAIFSTRGMAEVWQRQSPIPVDIIEVKITPVKREGSN